MADCSTPASYCHWRCYVYVGRCMSRQWQGPMWSATDKEPEDKYKSFKINFENFAGKVCYFIWKRFKSILSQLFL